MHGALEGRGGQHGAPCARQIHYYFVFPVNIFKVLLEHGVTVINVAPMRCTTDKLVA